ncbi:kinesin-like protein KIN-4A [Bidens hawaiensis]|uniref:kinesin-like protein KIN-4A n=1 Tax=Bidens hawaiensis TaxID=980011 RepID=UPI00404A5EB0
METSPENCNVKVAVHIRPLLHHERKNGGQKCLDVVPGTSQVLMGAHSFIFDHVYGGGGSPSKNMFQDCVIPLLDAPFQGYNSTVIAYGQTGSGKTYTMGTSPKETSHTGLMFQVMNTIFNKIQALQHQSEFQLHVSFIEILKEEVRDLLDSGIIERLETRDGNPENAVPGKQPLPVRKTSEGGLSLSGSTEVSVSTQREMAACLEQLLYNKWDELQVCNSRSHTIFTIILEQKDKNKDETSSNQLIMSEEYRCAKLHLVDLAGSERAKRAGSEGVRLKEGIQINKGLLALGNVISALGDEKKRKEGLHIPYRDSKLTRLLQASLGGNCKTVMIACASPADYNAEETLNTLKYANRARNIQNKASVQKEVFPADTHKLRQQLRLLHAELSHRKEAELVEVQDFKRKVDLLETNNSELEQKIHEYSRKCASVEATNSQIVQKIHEYQKTHVHKMHEFQQTHVQKMHEYQEPHEDAKGSQCTTSPKAIIGSTDVEALNQHSREEIIALEEDKRLLQMERDELRGEIARLGESTTNVQTMNAQNHELATEISNLEAKHEQEIELIKQKCHDAKKRLQDELRSIKSQKVQLQQKVKHDEEQYRQWKTNQEKQMVQDSSKTEVQLQKMHALYQRQAQVLQRKTEEAERATKKLKELLKPNKNKLPTRRETVAQPRGQNRSGQIKTLKRWLDNELDKVMHVYKLRTDHEKQTLRHAKLKEDLSILKQQDRHSHRRPSPQRGGPSLSPNTQAVRIVSLESKVKSSSTALSKLSSQIQEAGRGHDPASAGRWKALHSLGDAKDLLQHLFCTAIEARRRLLEKEYETKDNRYSGSTATQTTSIQNIGIEFPLPFPESKELDYKPGICNRPLQVVVKQTQKMIPIAHVLMKKLPLGEQMMNRWRRSHDEWLIQFKWKWQKPWKLSHLIKTNDLVRNSDDKLKGQDLSLRLGPTTGSSQSY